MDYKKLSRVTDDYRGHKSSREAEVSTMQKQKALIKKYRAAFENACDDLYYGYGYGFWRKTAGIDNDEEAKLLWKAAVDKMANDE